MRYIVLFPASAEATEGKTWAIVDAEEPAQAASMVSGRAIAPDDKALVVELDKEPTAVYAKVGWSP